jgi:hypothetical protein
VHLETHSSLETCEEEKEGAPSLGGEGLHFMRVLSQKPLRV